MLALPSVGLAFVPDAIPNNIAISVTSVINGLFNVIWPVVVAVIIIMFIYAGVMFLVAQGDPGKVATARLAVIWGMAGVTVILLAFSIITIVRLTIGGGAL